MGLCVYISISKINRAFGNGKIFTEARPFLKADTKPFNITEIEMLRVFA